MLEEELCLAEWKALAPVRHTLIYAKLRTWKITKFYLSALVAHVMTYTSRNEGEDVEFCQNAHIWPQFNPFSQMTSKVFFHCMINDPCVKYTFHPRKFAKSLLYKHKLKKHIEVQSKLKNSEPGGGSDSKTRFPCNGASKEVETVERARSINQLNQRISNRERH